MSQLRILFLFPLLALGISACQSTQKFQAENCHYDAAFERGANDAKDRKNLEGESIATKCPEATRAEVRKGYREGYDNYAQNNRGFIDIVKDKIKNVDVGGKPKTCRENKDGQDVCGYGCVENNGDVKCAQSSNHACISSRGEVYCGLNCRENKSGKVVCDERETL